MEEKLLLPIITSSVVLLGFAIAFFNSWSTPVNSEDTSYDSGDFKILIPLWVGELLLVVSIIFGLNPFTECFRLRLLIAFFSMSGGILAILWAKIASVYFDYNKYLS